MLLVEELLDAVYVCVGAIKETDAPTSAFLFTPIFSFPS